MDIKRITVMKVVQLLMLTTMACAQPVQGARELADVLAASFVGLERLTHSGIGPVNLTCNFNVSLLQPIIWKDSDGRLLNSSSSYVNDFRSSDQYQRYVSFVLTQAESHVYVMCIDPRTYNVIRGFQIQHTDGFELLTTNKLTECAVGGRFWTILNCQDMYIPPVVVESCYWTSQQQPHDQKGDPIQVLGLGGLFKEKEGWYACDCKKGHGHTLIMNFTVHPSKGEARDTANYQFCQHVYKWDHSSDQGNYDSLSRDALGSESTPNYSQSQAAAYLGFMILFILVSVTMGILLTLQCRGSLVCHLPESGPPAPESGSILPV